MRYNHQVIDDLIILRLRSASVKCF